MLSNVARILGQQILFGTVNSSVQSPMYRTQRVISSTVSEMSLQVSFSLQAKCLRKPEDCSASSYPPWSATKQEIGADFKEQSAPRRSFFASFVIKH